MATARLVNTNFWKDTYVIDLDPIEKLLFLYFLTNPNTNMAGAYEISLRQVAFDTGIDHEMVKKILNRFCIDQKMYYEKGWLILKNFIKHQRLNPSIKIAIEKQIGELPEWLRVKVTKVEDENKQISLLIDENKTLSPQTVPSHPPIEANRIEENRKEAKAFYKNKKTASSPAASREKIDSVRAVLAKKGIVRAK